MNASMTMTSEDDCLICGAGTFCPVGSASEALCAPGTYNDVAGRESCRKCAAGKFTEAEGATACEACIEGYYCAEGSAAPLPCEDV